MHRSCDPAPLLPCCPPLAPACLCFGSGSQVPAALPPSFAPDWPACALLCRFPPPLPPQALLSQVRGLSPSTLTCRPPRPHLCCHRAAGLRCRGLCRRHARLLSLRSPCRHPGPAPHACGWQLPRPGAARAPPLHSRPRPAASVPQCCSPRSQHSPRHPRRLPDLVALVQAPPAGGG